MHLLSRAKVYVNREKERREEIVILYVLASVEASCVPHVSLFRRLSAFSFSFSSSSSTRSRTNCEIHIILEYNKHWVMLEDYTTQNECYNIKRIDRLSSLLAIVGILAGVIIRRRSFGFLMLLLLLFLLRLFFLLTGLRGFGSMKFGDWQTLYESRGGRNISFFFLLSNNI